MVPEPFLIRSASSQVVVLLTITHFLLFVVSFWLIVKLSTFAHAEVVTVAHQVSEGDAIGAFAARSVVRFVTSDCGIAEDNKYVSVAVAFIYQAPVRAEIEVRPASTSCLLVARPE